MIRPTTTPPQARMAGALAALALAALASCGLMEKPEAGWRDPSKMIASAALFEPERFNGTWHQVAAFGAEATCGALAEDWRLDRTDGYTISGTRCAAGRAEPFVAEGRLSGPGRIVRTVGGQEEEIWILWVDGDYRIAAVGTPSGRFGRILSRDPAPRSDLFTAAREILDFNGYDVRRLTVAH